MSTDRRWTERFPLVTHVLVYYGGLGFVQCRTRNVSQNGLYIETGRISLNHSASVELLFSNIHNLGQCRLLANIARVDGHGAGLRFSDDLDSEAHTFISRLLNTQGRISA